MISRRRFLSLSSVSGCAAFLGGADALALEPRFGLVVKEWKINSAYWPPASPSLRIGVLTDIHSVEPWMPARRLGKIVSRLNSLEPDVIVLLGDYVNALRSHFYSATVSVDEWSAALSGLRAPHGVYAVLGNHDWWSGEVPAIRRTFSKAGIHLLENDAIKVESGRKSYWIAGLADQLNYNSRGEWDVRETVSKITDPAPIVFLAHEPDIFPKLPAMVSLTLAGHTHGGQIYIPFIGRPVFERRSFGGYANSGSGRYAYGHFHDEGRHMIVSSGLGLSHLPIRFLVPPEIAIVTLGSLEA